MIPALIHFITTHIERIIMFSAAGVFIVVGWALYRDIFGKKNNAISNTDEIEDMLKRILNQTTSAIARTEVLGDAASGNSANGTSPAGAGGTGASAKELSKIKDQLEEKLKLIEELQAEVAKAKSMDASTELLQKIKTLEGKLAEYEIIEDDIADLSHYKDENNRLKKELDALKQGGPALVDAFAATVAEGGVSQAASTTESSVKQETSEVTAAPQAVTPVEESKAPVVPLEEKVAAIQANVAEQEKAQKITSPEETKADVFAEFSDPASTEGADPLAELGDIDTNRMIEELQGLGTEMDASALEEAPNIDKMAEEAVKLDGDKKT